MQTSSKPKRFGTGKIKGIVSSETSNNARELGMMLPTLAFGIPGSTVCILILFALILHGLQPGPEILTRHLNLTAIMLVSLIVNNIIGSLIIFLTGTQFAKVACVKPTIIVPFMTVMVALGADTVKQ